MDNYDFISGGFFATKALEAPELFQRGTKLKTKDFQCGYYKRATKAYKKYILENCSRCK
jgi:hypothetical protein